MHGSVYISTEGFPANTNCRIFQPYQPNHFGHHDQADLPNHQGLKECSKFGCQGNFAHLFDHHYFHCLCSNIPASLYIWKIHRDTRPSSSNASLIFFFYFWHITLVLMFQRFYKEWCRRSSFVLITGNSTQEQEKMSPIHLFNFLIWLLSAM